MHCVLDATQAAQAAARDQEKRNKLREALTVRINKAVQEAHARGEDPAMYDTARVDKLVTDIEAALYEYVGTCWENGKSVSQHECM